MCVCVCVSEWVSERTLIYIEAAISWAGTNENPKGNINSKERERERESKYKYVKPYRDSVAEITSYFCLECKLIWPLWSSHMGWIILFSPDHFPGQHENGESPPNYLFLGTFRAGRTYFLSAPFIAAESQYHGQSRLTYGPFESTLLDQGFPVEHELDARNPPLRGTPSCRL